VCAGDWPRTTSHRASKGGGTKRGKADTSAKENNPLASGPTAWSPDRAQSAEHGAQSTELGTQGVHGTQSAEHGAQRKTRWGNTAGVAREARASKGRPRRGPARILTDQKRECRRRKPRSEPAARVRPACRRRAQSSELRTAGQNDDPQIRREAWDTCVDREHGETRGARWRTVRFKRPALQKEQQKGRV